MQASRAPLLSPHSALPRLTTGLLTHVSEKLPKSSLGSSVCVMSPQSSDVGFYLQILPLPAPRTLRIADTRGWIFPPGPAEAHLCPQKHDPHGYMSYSRSWRKSILQYMRFTRPAWTLEAPFWRLSQKLYLPRSVTIKPPPLGYQVFSSSMSRISHLIPNRYFYSFWLNSVPQGCSSCRVINAYLTWFSEPKREASQPERSPGASTGVHGEGLTADVGPVAEPSFIVDKTG